MIDENPVQPNISISKINLNQDHSKVGIFAAKKSKFYNPFKQLLKNSLLIIKCKYFNFELNIDLIILSNINYHAQK